MDLELIVRTSAILACACVVAALLRRAAPSTRHLVWQIAIVAVVMAPYLVSIAPALPIVPKVPQVSEVWFQTVPMVQQAPTVASIDSPKPGSENQTLAALGTFGTFGTCIVAGWFALCWLLSGLSVWRGSRPAPESWINEARSVARRIGLKQDVRIRRLHREASPHVAGLFHSVVMMPPSADTWTAEARQAALVHELTHIKRRDRRTQAMAQIACAIHWFNPLVWYASAALARERERACDDEVLRFGAKPSAYAALLLDIARSAASMWTPASALSMARPSAIEGRLLSILANAARTPYQSTKWIVGITITLLTTTILGADAVRSLPDPAPAIESKPRPLVKLMSLDDQQPASPITGTLVEALRDEDRQVREQAAIGLAFTPGTEVIDPLLAALKDPDAQVREKAAIGLAFRRDPKIVEPLLTAITDSDAQVREKAAIALGASGDDRAVAALTKAARDPDSQVREKAVAGLVLLGLRK
jgi:beta-lactamase regulating signal transducer with metallopeptidase domain